MKLSTFMRTVLGALALAAVLCFLFATNLHAQGVTGNIRGTVVDTSGAAVADASVTITDVAKGATRTVTTSANGTFEVTFLPPATYNLSVTKSGFKTFTQGGIVVQADGTYLVSAKLEVGTMSETVEVSATPVQIDKTTMQLGGEVAGTAITNFPLLNRNWLGLQQTLSGVVAASDRFGTYATNGSRSQSNDFTINGMDAIDLPLNTPEGGGADPLNADAIQEVKVVDSSANPEYGRNSGATENVVMRTGTNEWHGSAYDYYRSTGFNARSYFQLKTTPYHQHQFGGTFGGPVIHNKFFFFFGYQGVKQLVGGSANTPVFSSAERGGDWSSSVGDLAGGNVSPFPLYGDAASTCPVGGAQCPAGTPYSTLFSTGIIPSQDFNPISAALMSKYVPLPNNVAQGTYAFSNNTNLRADQYLGTLDYHLGSSDTADFFFFVQPQNSAVGLPFDGATLPGFPETDHENFYRYTLRETHIISPRMVNQFLIGWQRFHYHAVNPVNNIQPSAVGFTGITPQFPESADLPNIGVTGFFNIGFTVQGPQPRTDDTGQMSDNFTYTTGNHNFRFGGDVRRTSVYNPFEYENAGSFGFGGAGTFTTGLPGADFLLGIPDSYGQSSGNIINARAWMIYSYIQDQWQIRHNFTFTYGIGWQIDTPLTDLYNNGVSVVAFSPGRQSTVYPTAPAGLLFPGDQGINSSGGSVTHYNNFGPRVGFAYSPTSKFVVRGGWGIYYDTAEEELTLQNLLLPPFSLADAGSGDVGLSPGFANPWASINPATVCLADCGTSKEADQAAGAIANKYPFKAPAPGSAVDFSFYEPLSLNVTDPKWDVPYVMNFNLTTQYQVNSSTIATLSYVGSLGRKLEGVIEGNPDNEQAYLNDCDPADVGNFAAQSTFSNCIAKRTNAPVDFPDIALYPPGNIFASVGTQGTFLNSNYNSAQLTVEHAMSHGLFIRGAYTYAHGLDYGSSYENSYAGGSVIDPFDLRLAYGDSTYDARQRLVLEYEYDVPNWSFGVLPQQLTKGWAFTGITTFQTGFPIQLSESDDRTYQCSGWAYYGCWDHPEVSGTALQAYGDPRNSPSHEWFNPSAYTREAYGTIGNAGRDLPFHGPGINDFDFSFWKDTSIGERYKIRLRADLFNMWNHANFANPSGNVVSGNFGKILNTTGNARILQLSAHFQF